MSGALKFYRVDFLDEDSPAALAAWHALSKEVAPERGPLDDGEYREIEAVRCGERQWRYDR